jgi:hypothetical protein
MVQVFQLRLPGIPHFGAGAAIVGHGEQVHSAVTTPTADLSAKALITSVAQISLLGDPAHAQMLTRNSMRFESSFLMPCWRQNTRTSCSPAQNGHRHAWRCREKPPM